MGVRCGGVHDAQRGASNARCPPRHSVAGTSSSAPSPWRRRRCSTLVARDVAAAAVRDRVAIIGAGAGGVTAAYFLAGTHAVDLFEARSKVGGHCDSHVIDYHGEPVTVDLGAQFFHPDTHPIYVTLLEQLRALRPSPCERPRDDRGAGQPLRLSDRRGLRGLLHARVSTVDPPDVRPDVPGERRQRRDHLQLEDRPAGQPATDARSQPLGAGPRQCGNACADASTRRLVCANAEG